MLRRVATLLSTVMVLAGCPSSPGTSEPETQPSPDAAQQLLDTFYWYIATGNVVAVSGDTNHPWLTKYAAPGAYDRLLTQLDHAETGRAFRNGVKVRSAEAFLLGDDRGIVTAWLDVSQFRMADADYPADYSPRDCRLAAARLARDQDRWRVTDSSAFHPPTPSRYLPDCPTDARD